MRDGRGGSLGWTVGRDLSISFLISIRGFPGFIEARVDQGSS